MRLAKYLGFSLAAVAAGSPVFSEAVCPSSNAPTPLSTVATVQTPPSCARFSDGVQSTLNSTQELLSSNSNHAGWLKDGDEEASSFVAPCDERVTSSSPPTFTPKLNNSTCVLDDSTLGFSRFGGSSMLLPITIETSQACSGTETCECTTESEDEEYRLKYEGPSVPGGNIPASFGTALDAMTCPFTSATQCASTITQTIIQATNIITHLTVYPMESSLMPPSETTPLELASESTPSVATTETEASTFSRTAQTPTHTAMEIPTFISAASPETTSIFSGVTSIVTTVSTITLDITERTATHGSHCPTITLPQMIPATTSPTQTVAPTPTQFVFEITSELNVTNLVQCISQSMINTTQVFNGASNNTNTTSTQIVFTESYAYIGVPILSALVGFYFSCKFGNQKACGIPLKCFAVLWFIVILVIQLVCSWKVSLELAKTDCSQKLHVGACATLALPSVVLWLSFHFGLSRYEVKNRARNEGIADSEVTA